MLSEFLPFQISIDTSTVAGACLWAFALYIGLASLREKMTSLFEQWLNWAEGSLYFSIEEYEKDKVLRESQNAFYASLLSILPFLIFGTLADWGVEWYLGHSWAISLGMMACVGGGVYELGRLDSENRDREEQE